MTQQNENQQPPNQPELDPDPAEDPNLYPADKARQGYVALNTPLKRHLFFGGLIGIAILVIVMAGVSIGSN